MKPIYITIAGTNHYYETTPFRVGQKVRCYKEPENHYDEEAIRVEMKGFNKVGYVSNSVYTTAKGTQSAGRIYDKVGKKFKAKVCFVTRREVICRVLMEEEAE